MVVADGEADVLDWVVSVLTSVLVACELVGLLVSPGGLEDCSGLLAVGVGVEVGGVELGGGVVVEDVVEEDVSDEVVDVEVWDEVDEVVVDDDSEVVVEEDD